MNTTGFKVYSITLTILAIVAAYLSNIHLSGLSIEGLVMVVCIIIVNYFEEDIKSQRAAISSVKSLVIFTIIMFEPLYAIVGMTVAYCITWYKKRNYTTTYNVLFNIAQSTMIICMIYGIARIIKIDVYNNFDLWKIMLIILISDMLNVVFVTIAILLSDKLQLKNIIPLKNSVSLYYVIPMLFTPALVFMYVDRGFIGFILLYCIYLPLQATVAIHKKMNEYRKDLDKDSLTHAYSYRFFEQTIQSNLRNKIDFILMYMDLNKFKQINDLYGHVVGDRVLHMFSTTVLQIIPNNHYFCRYAGDEFAIILDTKSKEEAKLFAEKIIKHIDKIDVQVDDETTINIRVSIGIYQKQENDNTFHEVVEKADKAMYYSKMHEETISFYEDIQDEV